MSKRLDKKFIDSIQRKMLRTPEFELIAILEKEINRLHEEAFKKMRFYDMLIGLASGLVVGAVIQILLVITSPEYFIPLNVMIAIAGFLLFILVKKQII